MHSARFRQGLSGFVASTLLLATPAFADWVGDLRVKSAPLPGQKGPAPETAGKMYGRADKLRMDMDTPQIPGGMTILFDWEKRTGVILFHERKTAMVRNLDDLPVQIPSACIGKGQDLDACFTSQGYKKVGTEKVNGHPAVVYEGLPPGAEESMKRQKVWRPTDLPEVAYVRSQTFDPQNKLRAEINVTNIQVGAQPDSRFGIPEGYQTQDALRPVPTSMSTFKAEDLQGKTPEQIQEMIRQRMSQQSAPATPPAPKTPAK
ncbi:hypothetical protein DRW03_16785 [Corallococcus sp. H22C18031201]|uniref:LolA family protein n=1 Tax=Citreicoccus inhibens TaxID=2849499 RepID=UPI000E74349E|nr:hypothetical protein [Citreicoccus inhibens]MBU8896722.1 hypothetical protein [Citreicoccus inhibens]RJS21974.1 hypothetical protein DRW03_16785 [Corallococcus sp. H22C18031201]